MAATNGASLEDCKTNVFVLTELNGLKWKRYVTPEHSGGGGDLSSDAVLLAYGRCITQGLLCVWRRAPPPANVTTPQTKIDLRLDSDKELWVFWYGDEPESIKQLAGNLSNPDPAGSSGNVFTDIEYETRCLLFKALHNYLERYLLSKGYLRFGRWFTKPVDTAETSDSANPFPSYVLAFNFSFFVHGEKNVCVCVQAQRQPPIRRLQRAHLQLEKQKVLLAPWSWTGTLVPASNWNPTSTCATTSTTLAGAPPGSNREKQAYKDWREWMQFYPLPDDDDEKTANMGYQDPEEKERRDAARARHLPKMIEVSIAGVRMFYPSCYAAVLTAGDHLTQKQATNQQQQSTTNQSASSSSSSSGSGSNCGACTRQPGQQEQTTTSTTTKSAATTQQQQQQQQRATAQQQSNNTNNNSVDVDKQNHMFHTDRPVSGQLSMQRAVEHLTTSLDPIKINHEHTQQHSKSAVQLNVEELFVDMTDRDACGCAATTGDSKVGVKHQPAASNVRATVGGRNGNRFSSAPFHRRVSPTTIGPEPQTSTSGVGLGGATIKSEPTTASAGGPQQITSAVMPSQIAVSNPQTPYSIPPPQTPGSVQPATPAPSTPLAIYGQQQQQMLTPLMMPTTGPNNGPVEMISPVENTAPSTLSSTPNSAGPSYSSLSYDADDLKLAGVKRKHSATLTYQGGGGPASVTTSSARDQAQTTTSTPTAPSSALKHLIEQQQQPMRPGGDSVVGAATLTRLSGVGQPSQTPMQSQHQHQQSLVTSSTGTSATTATVLTSNMTGTITAQQQQLIRRAMRRKDKQNGIGKMWRRPKLDRLDVDVVAEMCDEVVTGSDTLYSANTAAWLPSNRHRWATFGSRNVQLKSEPGGIKLEELGLGQDQNRTMLNKWSNDIPKDMPEELLENAGQTNVPVTSSNTSPMTAAFNTFMSPPNSNEQQQQVNSVGPPPSTVTSGGAPPNLPMAHNGPPSIETIYPTPPSQHDIMTQQLSPENAVPQPQQQSLPTSSSIPPQLTIAAVRPTSAQHTDGSHQDEGVISPVVVALRTSDVCTATGALLESPTQKRARRRLTRDSSFDDSGCSQESTADSTTLEVYERPKCNTLLSTKLSKFTAIQLHSTTIQSAATNAKNHKSHLASGLITSAVYKPTQTIRISDGIQQPNNANNNNNLSAGRDRLIMPSPGGAGAGPPSVSAPGGTIWPPPQSPRSQQPGRTPQPQQQQPPSRSMGIRTVSTGSLGSPAALGIANSPAGGPGSVGAGPIGGPYSVGAGAPAGAGNPAMSRSTSFHGGPMTPQQPHSIQQPPMRNPPSVLNTTFDSMQSPLNRAPASVDNTGMAYTNINQPHSQMPASHQHPQLHSQQTGGMAEAHSLWMNQLMSDTLFDLPRDTAFDACPVCACNMNIKGTEVGWYVPATPAQAQQQQQNQNAFSNVPCNCGFSAIRYRLLSCCSGVFFEDETEATGIEWMKRQPSLTNRANNPMDIGNDNELIELIRQQSLCHDLASDIYGAAVLSRQCDEFYIPRNSAAVQTDDASVRDYEIVILELEMLKQLMNLAIDAASMITDCTIPSRADFARERGQQAYPFCMWGYQRAYRQTDAAESECVALIEQLMPTIREAMQQMVLTGKQNSPSLLLNTGADENSVSQSSVTTGTGGGLPTVEGPLTWRLFERKLMRVPNAMNNADGMVDECKPEPIPQVALTTEHDSVSISPLSLRLWDRLLLEPLSQPKDIVYVAVMPDNKWLLQRARLFFRELSKTYENHRFGRHCAFHTDATPEGLMKVGTKKLELLQSFNDPNQVEMLKEKSNADQLLFMFRQVCSKLLAGVLETENAFEPQSLRDVVGKDGPGAGLQGADSMMPPPQLPDSIGGVGNSDSTVTSSDVDADDRAQGQLPHVVVVYLVNPFCMGARTHETRVATKFTRALLSCYLDMLKKLAPEKQPFVQLEIVPMQTLLDTAGAVVDYAKDARDAALSTVPEQVSWIGARSFTRQGAAESLRQIAFSVYTETRCINAANCLPVGQPKLLTGFGPAAARAMNLHKTGVINMTDTLVCGSKLIYDYECGPEDAKLAAPSLFRFYSSPFALAQSGNAQNITAAAVTSSIDLMTPTCSHNTTDCNDDVLFVSYCLSDEQRWLLATVTNQRGTILESCVINLTDFKPDKPDRFPPQRLAQWQREMRNLANRMSVIRQALNSVWHFLLGVMGTRCHPWRLVIGRLGKLGHSELRVWSQLLKPQALRKYGQYLQQTCSQCQHLSALADSPAVLSACLVAIEPETHIRLFANSFQPDDKFGQTAKACPLSTPDDGSATHIMVFPTSATISLNASGTCVEDGADIDIGGLGLDNPDDLGLGPGLFGELDGAGARMPGDMRPSIDVGDAGLDSIDQQPLAVGLYVSTAPAPGLPPWFWASCPAARGRSPVHLKASLHHCTRVQGDSDRELFGGAQHTQDKSQMHPLESTHTDDVLRYVLETYNALSWLNVDLHTGDRRSCLPLHIQALLRLYRALGVFMKST